MRRLVRMMPALCSLLLIGACEEYKPPPPEKISEEEQAERRKNIVTIDIAVPAGKKVACDDWMKAETASLALGDDIAIKEASKTIVDATSVCKLVRGGELPPLKATKELKPGEEVPFKVKAQKLGVQPGDTYCTVSVYCSLPMDDEKLRKRCEEKGHEVNTSLGQYACVKRYQRASEYAYTYQAVHKGTNCMIEAMGGPSVTDQVLVEKCTKLGLESLSKDNIKNYK